MDSFPRRIFLALFGTALTSLSKTNAQSGDDNKTAEIMTPHNEALLLIQSRQAEEIIKAEREYFARKGTGHFKGDIESYWWYDIIERTWTVQRPFSPGIADSTHSFTVSYKINREIVALWSVDTYKKTIVKAKNQGI